METAHALSRKATPALYLFTLILILSALGACTSILDSPITPSERAPSPSQPATPREVTPTSTVLASPTSPGIATPIITATQAVVSSPTAAPSLMPTALPCWSLGGQITQHTLRTPISPLPWEFRVYTPPCYDQQTTRQYPVLILIHGSTFNDDQWDRMGVDETADALIARGERPPFLILMPRDRIWTDEPKADPFGQALIEYLIPWVDENYRTLPERQYRAIGGLSRGASWAVHLGLEHWELFGAIGAHSLPVFVTDPTRLKRWLEEIPTDAMPRFFLDIGEKDYLLKNAVWFENLLSENNIPHEWYLYTGRHEEAYWESHLEQYLRWYAETWSHLQ